MCTFGNPVRVLQVNFLITRLHSIRMRTARVLTVSPSMLCTGGVPGPGGVCSWWGMYLVLGGVPGRGGVPGPRGGVPGPGSGVPGPGEVYLVPGGAPGPMRVYLVLGGTWYRGGVPGRGCTWSQGLGGVSAPGVYLVPGGGGVSGTPPCEQNDKQVQKYYLAPNFVCGR